MEQTWRWFGPDDPVTINDIRQTGATGIVTALHHIPNGEIWSVEAIQQRCREIEWDDYQNTETGLNWSVVESVPVTEEIKQQRGNWKAHIENYKQTLTNLAVCDIHTVCYNFMPVLDWTRTDLAFQLPDGSKALRFDATAFAAFDLYILQRKSAVQDYTRTEQKQAEQYYRAMSADDIQGLTSNIIAGLPGAEEDYDLQQLEQTLADYSYIDTSDLRNNLSVFLQEIIPLAEQLGIRMALHPDDPPGHLLGLPRIASSEEDLQRVLQLIDSPANGLTLCCGSLGAQPDIDLAGIASRLGHRINFAHLRNTHLELDNRSFYEADHLQGDHDMYAIVRSLMQEQYKRIQQQREDHCIPMRPDHGHQMLDDLHKTTNPGYSCIGRMRGLAELRGLMMGIERSLLQQQEQTA
ncbi:mannonate dehydratase [Endozoicomonadaceae bacterium StTr2]